MGKNINYEELLHTGQKGLSLRWVFTDKYIDGEKKVKGRLMARGFNGNLNQSDSPTWNA